MTQYKAVDIDKLFDQLSQISSVLEDADLTDENRQQAATAMSEINSIVHSIEKPIHIEDRAGTFEIVVVE